MTKRTYKIIAIVAAIVSAIGLLSFFGGIRAVNIGAFVFPAAVAGWAFYRYRKSDEAQ